MVEVADKKHRSGRTTAQGFGRNLLALPFAGGGLSDRPRLDPFALIGKERTIESFQGFFTTMGEEITSKIVFICSDMWDPHLKVISEKCPEALHILDRFHIVAKMNKAPDEVRAGESRRMAGEGRTPLLKKSRWLLLKREENLKAEQRFRLRDLLRYDLKTVRATFSRKHSSNSGITARPPGKFLDEDHSLGNLPEPECTHDFF